MMFRRVYSSGFTQRPDPTVMGAFSGLEIACWDILGKDRDRPVWALLGGMMNERVRSYTYLYPQPGQTMSTFWTDPDAHAEAAAAMLDLGFTAVKFDPAGPYTVRGGHQPAMSDITRSVAFCKAIREAVGDRADLLFGTHGQFTTAGAIRLGQALEPYSPLWFEEPIPPDNLLEFAEVARAVRIPVATGERLTTKAEFAAVLRTGGAKILQPALGRAGGIWEAKKIAAIAEVYNAEMAPHLYAGPVEWAANIHLVGLDPEPPDGRDHRDRRRVPPQADPQFDPLGGGLHPRPERAPALASTSTRIWPARIPIPATGCIWRCRKRPATTSMATISRAAHRPQSPEPVSWRPGNYRRLRGTKPVRGNMIWSESILLFPLPEHPWNLPCIRNSCRSPP